MDFSSCANLIKEADVYAILFWAYIAIAFLTLCPTLLKIVKGVSLNPGGASFEKSSHFTEDSKVLLTQHYSRLMGTLGFWKKRAETFTSFHYYCVVWTILSSWAVPVIASQSSATSPYAKAFLVLVSSHVALALSFHKGLRVADGMKAFRHGESEFYDLYRRLLDRPAELGPDERTQIDYYFSEVEKIRRFVRSSETESMPSIDSVKTK